MEIKFVEAEDLRVRGTALESAKELLVALKNHPNRWAEVPTKVSAGTVVQRWKALFPDFDFKASGGNNLAKDHPDKKYWTVFVRYSPKSEGK